MAHYSGTSGDDIETGTPLADFFRLTQGGDDTAYGGDGDDIFRLGAALSVDDVLDGGDGNDTVLLTGDYSGGFTFGDDTLTGVEKLRLNGAFDYSLTTNDANVAAHATLVVHAGRIGPGHHLTFDGSAETDSRFRVYGSTGSDTVTGGARRDTFHLGNGGNDAAYGGASTDIFLLGSKFTSADHVDGGAGNDTLVLDGEYNNDDAPFVIAPSMMSGIERIELRGAHYSNILIDNACTAAGSTLVVDASAVGTSTTVVYIDETDAHIHAIANAGNAFFHGGTQSDIFDMRHVLSGQASTANAYGGDDIFLYSDGFRFTRTAVDGGAGNDTLSFEGDYTALRITASSSAFNVENLVFHGGHDYTGVLIEQDVTSTPGNVSGNTLHIDASGLGAGDVFSANLSGATSAGFDIVLGAGGDTVVLSGSGPNAVTGGAGADTITCGAADDTFRVAQSSDSNSAAYDTVSGFDADNDQFDLFFAVTNVDAQAFSVSAATMDSNFGTHLSDYICTVVTVNGGDLINHKFLVINADTGNGYSYEAGVDLVIDITGCTGTFDTGDFI